MAQNKRGGMKPSGVSSEVYAIKDVDIKKISEHFEEKEYWLQWMYFILSCNLGRRSGDMLKLKWSHFFYPNGDFRENLKSISEEKTGKFATPRINEACRYAIKKYIAKTGCNPAKDDYSVDVFMQLSGTHKGKTISYQGIMKSINRACEECGLRYNVGTHSFRKTFGRTCVDLNPNDNKAVHLVQEMFGHNDEKTTNRYIGLTQDSANKLCDDVGKHMMCILSGDPDDPSGFPIITLRRESLYDVITKAYQAGKNNFGIVDDEAHINAIKEIMSEADRFAEEYRR